MNMRIREVTPLVCSYWGLEFESRCFQGDKFRDFLGFLVVLPFPHFHTTNILHFSIPLFMSFHVLSHSFHVILQPPLWSRGNIDDSDRAGPGSILG